MKRQEEKQSWTMALLDANRVLDTGFGLGIVSVGI